MLLEKFQSYEHAAQEDRCSPRTKLAIPAQLRMSGARAFQTVVHDLSISGFSASAISRIRPGQTCWITLPGLSALHAEAIWWENSVVGCAFTELLSPVVHDNILAKHSPSAVYRSAS
ncbi:MAG: PilZ domain-containing protein [Pontixanthobacter sp.]